MTAALGDSETASRARSEALALVDGIADGLSDLERRRMFLDLPEVQQLRAG